MAEIKDKNLIERSREQVANERTFLSWIRTSIELMGFGFVIVKFTLFLKQLTILLETNDVKLKTNYTYVGIIMVMVGLIIAILAFLQYKKMTNNFETITLSHPRNSHF